MSDNQHSISPVKYGNRFIVKQFFKLNVLAISYLWLCCGHICITVRPDTCLSVFL